MKKILITTALIASLGLATTPVKADTDDFIKVIGAVLILNQIFDKDDRRHYPQDGYPQHGGYGQVYDDRGIYERTCNDNLGCAPRDNNRWNDPRGYGYAQGRDNYGYPTGQVCGKRSQRVDQWTTETLHLDCNGNVMFITRHQR